MGSLLGDSMLMGPVLTGPVLTGSVLAGWSCGWDVVRRTGPSHMSMEPASSGSKVRGTQAASSSIRRTPNEYS
jgi:hypothetical protein